MKLFIFILLPALLFSDDLKSLLEFAQKNNNLINASKIVETSKKSELSATKHSYLPTIDANAFYERDDKPTPFYPGTTYGVSAKISYSIYDGGKKAYITKQKKDELLASEFKTKASKKDILLVITKNFFNLKSLYASLDATQEASKAVKAQLTRIKQFYVANLATSDDVDRLQSAYDRTLYTIESLKFKIFSLKKLLELEVGKKIISLDNSKFQKSKMTDDDNLDAIKALTKDKNALTNQTKMIDSYYHPNIKIEDSYTIFGYQDKPITPLLDTQNKIMATLSLRIFDFGALSEKKEALRLKVDAMNEKISYKIKEQNMEREIALRRIKTTKLNIHSTKSALKSATSALKTITKKYQNGIVEHVTYLDALSSRTEAYALYQKSLNDLEIAYALYYYYNTKNLEDYL